MANPRILGRKSLETSSWEARLRPSFCFELTIGTNLCRCEPVVEISLWFSRRSKGFKMNLHLAQSPTLVDAMLCIKDTALIPPNTKAKILPYWGHLGPGSSFLQESKA